MPLTALALVIAAALLHATWNLAAKKAGGNHHFVMMGALMTVVIWAPVGWWVARDTVITWSASQWGIVFASTVIHLLYFNVLLKGYRVGDLTVVYPVARGTGPLLSATGAILVLGETLTWASVLGVVSIAAGILLITGGIDIWRPRPDKTDPSRVKLGIVWGTLTGCFIAAYTVIDGYAVKVMLLSPILLNYFGNLLRIPLMLPTVWRDRRGFTDAWRSQWRHALLMAVLGPLAYVLVLYAVLLAPLSHVAPAREISMLFAALIGGHLLGESDKGTRLLGAVSMAIGVILLALA